MPCFTTALSFYDGYRHDVLPANLIQVSCPSRGGVVLTGRRPVPVAPTTRLVFRLSGITSGLTLTNS